MRVIISVLGVIFGAIAGGTVGGFIGYWIGTAPGVSDPENTWAWAVIIGGATGVALSVALVSGIARKTGWVSSLFVGGASGIASATVVLAWLFLMRS
jgi:hypothetical protein